MKFYLEIIMTRKYISQIERQQKGDILIRVRLFWK